MSDYCHHNPCGCSNKVVINLISTPAPTSTPQPSGTIPSGIIVMWSGSITNIPDGWLLCDGTKGTPDLRDRFVLGTVINSEIGNTGGNASIVLSEAQLATHSHSGITDAAGIHNHTGTTDLAGLHNHTGTTTSNGGHDHNYLEPIYNEIPVYNVVLDGLWTVSDSADKTGKTSVNGAHTHNLNITQSGEHDHTFTTDESGLHAHSFNTNTAGSGEPINITNPYYKLAFIMKE